MRTLVDIPEDDLRALAELGEQSRKSRAALIREAVAAFLAAQKRRPPADAFGLWGSAGPEGVAYQRRIRSEW